MSNSRLMVAVVAVCCASFVCSGCLRSGVKKTTKSDVDNGALKSITDADTISGPAVGGGVLPARDIFEKGKRVDSKFDTVLFDFDSAQVAEGERAKVEALAQFMKNDPATVVVLEGNCDERGSTEYNISLGERRALAVRAYLTSLGIDAERMQPRSYGEEKPANPGHDEESWRVNRRVEFALMKAN